MRHWKICTDLTRCLLTIAIIQQLLLPSVLASVPQLPPTVVIRNLARGSALKMMADLSGGLPMEIWKSSVVLQHIRTKDGKNRKNDLQVLQTLIEERGFSSLWTGCSARMVEGFFSGAVLLTGKETLRRSLLASPVVRKTVPPAVIGFVAGAGGGAAQALIMAPTSLLVTASTAKGGQSVVAAAKEVWQRDGLAGIYKGSSAVAARQATNWASRQGFTELVRPHINIAGVSGEIIAGCLGGALSSWNTPFEVARIHSQSRLYLPVQKKNDYKTLQSESLITTMRQILEEDGVSGLYVGLTPRIFQACYQTVFLVCIPRLIER
ncbi:mitochondrial [Seminavis robusta]|uniref:Mitochondrial n=1 Tax=Seminavis robusta TaxID=568900 RepID=A0A9N8DEA4_9STRA|nr:mitochondrial [Seminavis robusta]|eukprot:Sro31_g020490.1 mitochondrial (322) ;mRNA; r:140682-141647